MKKAKKTTARKSLSKKTATSQTAKTRAKSKAKIQVKAKANSPAKRKVARKSRFISPEDLLVNSITVREGRRAVIPASEERVNWASVNKLNHPNKTTAYRKAAGKKPIHPRAHSE